MVGRRSTSAWSHTSRRARPGETHAAPRGTTNGSLVAPRPNGHAPVAAPAPVPWRYRTPPSAARLNAGGACWSAHASLLGEGRRPPPRARPGAQDVVESVSAMHHDACSSSGSAPHSGQRFGRSRPSASGCEPPRSGDAVPFSRATPPSAGARRSRRGLLRVYPPVGPTPIRPALARIGTIWRAVGACPRSSIRPP